MPKPYRSFSPTLIITQNPPLLGAVILHSPAVTSAMGSRDFGTAAPLLHAPILGSRPPLRRLTVLSLALPVALLMSVAFFVNWSGLHSGSSTGSDAGRTSVSRKAKFAGPGLNEQEDYPFTEEMLKWQHTAFHFQPPRNFMSGDFFFFF